LKWIPIQHPVTENLLTSTANPASSPHILPSAWPHELDAYIALYKHHFQSAQYREAEKAVWATLREAARQGGFTRNYRRLTSESADWLNDKSVSRLYLFSLKALGVIRLRRGRIRLAESVLSKLLQLDPQDEIGGSNFLEIARNFNLTDS
jgi:hypothetical protein